jgi:lauroyl/myristoyl acyltransferase
MAEDQMFLHGTLIVIRSGRGGWFFVFHPHSAGVLFTDALGAYGCRLFLLGYGTLDIAASVEQRAAGAGARWRRMAAALYEMGATAPQPPARTMRWRVRRVSTLALGSGASLLSGSLRRMPVWLLRGMFEWAPETPIGKRTLTHLRPFIDTNLSASDFAGRSIGWRLRLARAVTAATIRCRFTEYLMLVLPRAKLTHFFQSISEPPAVERLIQELRTHDGAILVGLHSELYITAIFNVSRAAPVCILADIATPEHSIAARRELPPVPFAGYVESSSPMAARTLIDCLRAGKIVMLAFDLPPPPTAEGASIRTIPFLGQCVARFDTAAWLSAHSGKPVRFIRSFRRGRQLVVELSPPFSLAANGSSKQQIASLTEKIYVEAETFVRQHPESWLAWTYWHTLVVSPR